MSFIGRVWLKPAGLLLLGTGLLVLGAGVSFRSARHPLTSQQPGSAAPEPTTSLNLSPIAQQFRDDLVGALRARTKAHSLSQWRRSGFVPEEIMKNARALDLEATPAEFCNALLSLNGSELSTFEPALERPENTAWLPCMTPVRRRIEKHWDQTRARLNSLTEPAPPGWANAELPVRRIEFVPSTTLTGEELDPGEIALTFDGGPDANRTSRILATLKAQGVHATFFMSGEAANENSALAQKIRAEGHAIGALTWSNRSLVECDLKTGARDIERGIQGVGASSGGAVAFFRFPLGESRDVFADMLNDRKLISISWNIDSWDWKSSDPSEALEHISEELDQKRGGILTLHDGLTQTEILLPGLLQALRLRKLVPVVLGN